MKKTRWLFAPGKKPQRISLLKYWYESIKSFFWKMWHMKIKNERPPKIEDKDIEKMMEHFDNSLK